MGKAGTASDSVRLNKEQSVWFRVLLSSGQLGPGKIKLLRLIAETGSISGAALKLGMSHARSVKLVAELNALGTGPLIATRIGGEQGGGAHLTDRACDLLEQYELLETAIREAAAPVLLAMATTLSTDERASPCDR